MHDHLNTACHLPNKKLPTERLEVRRHIAHMMGKKARAVAAACFVRGRAGKAGRPKDTSRTWRRQVFEATKWSKVRFFAGVVSVSFVTLE